MLDTAEAAGYGVATSREVLEKGAYDLGPFKTLQEAGACAPAGSFLIRFDPDGGTTVLAGRGHGGVWE